MSGKSLKLEVSVGAKDIVHLTIGGDIDQSSLPEIKRWSDDVRKTIKEQYGKKSEKVLCLVDITHLKTYHPDVLTAIASLMKDNDQYVLRTATFGGSAYMIMAEDVVAALSGRKNLKAFATKDEALEWLQRGGEVAETTVEI